MTIRRQQLCAFLTGVAGLAIAMPAAGQTAAERPVENNQDAQEATTGPDEIIVTARRREERLSNVPIAVTAYTGEQLEAQGALDITDIGQTTPNTTLEASRGSNSTLTAFIRGVGQQDPVAGFEAGVGIYLDDVYLNRPQAAVLDIYDVERIEVLRGPQGTLYGRNTIGGAIKYVTRRLPQEPALKLRGTYGTYNQAEGVITASFPISDLVRVGGSYARLSRGGFGRNLNLGIDNYNKNVNAGRLTLEVGGYGQPVFIRITGDYTRDKSNPRNGHRLVPGIVSGTPVLANVYDTQAGLNNPRQDVKAYGVAMNISADLTDALTFRSISAYRYDKSYTPIDFDALPAVDVDVPAVYQNEQISQELQLLYQRGPVNGLVGFYYLDAKAADEFDVLLSTTVPNLSAATKGDVRTETYSVFGDFTFDVTPQLSVSLGGRYTHDTRRALILRQTNFGPSAVFGGTPFTLATTSNFTGSADFNRFTPRASVSFKPNSDNMVYASYAQGFKGGGFDPRGQSSQAADVNGDGVRSYQEIYNFLLFKPETVNSYEVGYKGSLFDRRLRLALTAFYADYRDVQIPGSVGCVVGGIQTFCGTTTNAAKASFRGVEAEAFARLAEGFAGAGSSINFNGSLGYIDGKYDKYVVNGVDVSNLRRIQNTPKFTGSATLAATFGGPGNGIIDASTTVSYRSETHQFEVPSPFLDQPGYALLDASLIYRTADDRFSIGLHGRNLFDKRYITSGYQFIATQPDGTPIYANGHVVPTLGKEGVVTTFYGPPRQLFVTATIKLGGAR